MSKQYYINMQESKTPAFGRKLYSLREIYFIIVNAAGSIRTMAKIKSQKIIDIKLIERIMLAVTTVNGCPMCSYGHAKMALKAGISDEEIKNFISGDFPDIPQDEIKAVLFAQHYADARSKLDIESWQTLQQEYGKNKAKAIFAATRMISMGNALGIPLSSIKSRFKGEGGDKRSSLFYELSVIILGVPMILIGILHALIKSILPFKQV